MVSTPRRARASAAADPMTPAPITAASTRSTDADAIAARRYPCLGGVRAPGGPPGLQNRCAGDELAGGFDSRPPPLPRTFAPARPRSEGLEAPTGLSDRRPDSVRDKKVRP